MISKDVNVSEETLVGRHLFFIDGDGEYEMKYFALPDGSAKIVHRRSGHVTREETLPKGSWITRPFTVTFGSREGEEIILREQSELRCGCSCGCKRTRSVNRHSGYCPACTAGACGDPE